MLMMAGGDPGNQLLVIGLAFGNLDEFKSKPHDTHIIIRQENSHIPFDVYVYSGDQNRMLGHRGDRAIFMLGLDMGQIDRLRQNPGKCLIRLDNAVYKTGVNIMIFSGETEAAMTNQMQEFIGEHTKVSTGSELKN